MKSLTLILLLSLTSGCGTISKVDDVAAKAKEYLATIDTKIAEVKTWTEDEIKKAEADRARYEALMGPWDTDGDGTLSMAEIKALAVPDVKDMLDSQKRQDWWDRVTDLDFWKAIGVAAAGVGGTIWAGKKGVGKLHNAGRAALGENDRVNTGA